MKSAQGNQGSTRVLLNAQNKSSLFLCHFVAAYFLKPIYSGVRGTEMVIAKEEMTRFLPISLKILRGVVKENEIDQLAFIAPHNGSVRMVDFRASVAEDGFRSFLLHPDMHVVEKQMPFLTKQRVLLVCDVAADGMDIYKSVLIARQYKNIANEVLVIHDEDRGVASHLRSRDVKLLALTDRSLLLKYGIKYPFPGEISQQAFDSVR